MKSGVGRVIVPLELPGLPPPGKDFLAEAAGESDGSRVEKVKDKATGKTVTRVVSGHALDRLVYRALYEPGFTMKVTTRPGVRETVRFIPGHVWRQYAEEFARELVDGNYVAPKPDGPRRCRVMVVGQMPGREEETYGRNFIGPTGEVLKDALDRLHVKGYGSWYVTNLVKFPPPGRDSTLRSDWVEQGKHLLHQEIRIVQPQFILCLGAEATKAVLGKEFTVRKMEGRVEELSYDVSFDGEAVERRTALVMSCIHPVNVARDNSLRRVLERGLARFSLLTRGVRPDAAEDDIDHRVVDDLAGLEEWIAEVDSDPDFLGVLGADAEWNGEHPVNTKREKGRAYLRLFQLAWKPKHAVCFKLRGQGGACAFFDDEGEPAIGRAVARLKEWLADKRIVGHFFNADLEWLVAEGLDLRGPFQVPRYDAEDGRLAWERTRTEGGADTGLMCHAVEETADYGLDAMVVRHLVGVPPYWQPMADWCKQQKEEFGVLEGYGDAPDGIIIPYACYDADVTLRLFHALGPLLDCDYEGNCCREAFWESMLATPSVLEIHTTGITVDKARVDELSVTFVEGRDELEGKIQAWAGWPDFNIRSPYHVREFLFGTEYSGKLDKVTGRPVSVRSPGAVSLGLAPIIDTSKPPRQWADLVAEGKEQGRTPSTNKAVLPQLIHAYPEYAEQLRWLQGHRMLDQVLKSVLRPPLSDKDGAYLRDEDTGLVYDKGLAACLCDDGRVRTHIYQTKETGRWSSARPPLQNISKTRDKDYKRLLGDRYKRKLRSILRATPGYALVEADYKGAELFGTAAMAGDETMLAHAMRANLPDEGYDEHGNEAPGGKFPHPDYYDIHSNVAVLAFGLDCPPTKQGLKESGNDHLRTLAKRRIFGLLYGQSDASSVQTAREEGVFLEVAEAAAVTAAIYAMYPKLVPFFEECRERADRPGWLCNCFGRFRRFPETRDRKLLGDFERQAMNFPIQSLVASAVSRAMGHLYHYRYDVGRPDMYRILMQIHDAILLEVPYENVGFVAGTVIPYCMRDLVPVCPTTLDGVPTNKGPYYLGFDVEVSEWWGEPMTPARRAELGIPAKFGTG